MHSNLVVLTRLSVWDHPQEQRVLLSESGSKLQPSLFLSLHLLIEASLAGHERPKCTRRSDKDSSHVLKRGRDISLLNFIQHLLSSLGLEGNFLNRCSLRRLYICSDPPEISVYPKHDVVPGEENNFICFMRNFYPPHISVNWTRNGVSVTGGVYISQFLLNRDGTFNLFSTLTSSPETEADVYSCTVEHEALDSPQTRTWDEPVITPSVTPTVVFAVGIAVGILGLSTGMFFVIKAWCLYYECNSLL
ncbi:H-2 class II histocompatibility antigen, A-Q alpha chain [Ictalurus punctatus]|uniref:H-2 class II histocompatibility antigen, A-Q alpha chain n=1 Tax=Ictalurus punctatus TaxID=7998 RepID=A0A2D0QXF2_ICTPU|nr:H-2 class II histocompatibility antigen, A-Q alpha chain [Ictalurus punctatus]